MVSERLKNQTENVEHRTNVMCSDHSPIVMECRVNSYLRTLTKGEKNQDAADNQEDSVTRINVPARTTKVVKINLLPTALRKGYLPRIATKDGIYIGEGVVTNKENACNLMVINTLEKNEMVEIRPQEIHPFEHYTPFEESAESETEEAAITDPEKHLETLKNLIQQDHLSEEEKESVHQLLRCYYKMFLLPGDKLGHTNLVHHKIPLKDNTLIHSKQYRHAPVHCEVIQEGIKKKLKDNIIEPSSSPMSSPIIIVSKKSDS